MGIAFYYEDIYLIVLMIVSLLYYRHLNNQGAESIINSRTAFKEPILFIFILIVLAIGLRPVHHIFVDMVGYAGAYEMRDLDEHNDPMIWWIAKICHTFRLPVSAWFLIIAFIYFYSYLLSARNLSRNNEGYIYLTFLVAFSTFAYATNGIRNGMGLGIMMLGITYYLHNKRNWKIAILLLACAILTHKSTLLPLVCFFAAYYFIDLKKAIFFWVFSVFVSVTVGDSIADIFLGLGFDDRLDKYLTAEVDRSFSHLGFRWDFLLYSVMPIWLGYYIVKVRHVQDRIFDTLLGTYVLSNAFWVMVIRAQFSDRFAYLSWFLYPFVIAYPLVEMDIWGDNQGKYAKRIFLAHMAFTLGMHFIYYGYIKHGILMS